MIMALTSILPHGERRTQVAGVSGIRAGDLYAKRQVRDTWKNHTLQLWGDDSR